MNTSGNTVLITGGSSGIGFQMAKEFVESGNTVIITGRDAKKLEEAKKQLGKVTTIQSDVSDPEAVAALQQRIAADFPELNMLINNAGIMWSINLQHHELSAQDLTKEIDVNVKGPIVINDAFLPMLKAKPNAAIVNVSSGLAFVPLPISPVYSATKAALHSYTLSLRAQLNDTSVKVFELAPPATRTELMDTFDDEDLEGISIMTVEDMVADFVKGLSKDVYEIRPGQANQMRFMSRFFPNFILKQMSKSVDRMHRNAAS